MIEFIRTSLWFAMAIAIGSVTKTAIQKIFLFLRLSCTLTDIHFFQWIWTSTGYCDCGHKTRQLKWICTHKYTQHWRRVCMCCFEFFSHSPIVLFFVHLFSQASWICAKCDWVNECTANNTTTIMFVVIYAVSLIEWKNKCTEIKTMRECAKN